MMPLLQQNKRGVTSFPLSACLMMPLLRRQNKQGVTFPLSA
jgi:hypothetical protein